MIFARTWRVLVSLLVALAVFASLGGDARAQDARRAGKVRLTTATGARGPLELGPDREGFSGELLIVNDGKEPLVVSRIAVRGDASDPRVPPKLAARVVEGGLPITIAPGSSRKAAVSWIQERGFKQRQLFGHVVVTTSDEEAGEVAMGVRAQVRGWLGPLEAHVLSLLVFVPILGAMATFLARLFGRLDARTAHGIASATLALQLAIAAYVHRSFVSDVARIDGNDGLQFVEHAVWIRGIGAELFLGVDGIAATTLLVTSIVVFLAVIFERTMPRGAPGYHAALLVVDAAVLGATTAMDGLLFVLFSSIAVVAAGLLVAAWGGEARRRGAIRVLLGGTFAVMLLAVAVCATARHADPTFLVDGTRVTTTFSFPELSRVALGAKEATFLGGSLAKVCFVLVLVASLVLLAAFPTHRWLGDALASASPAAGVFVGTALPTIGLCAFLRIGCGVLPDGMRWASGVVVALGAISAGYGALSALGQSDLRRLVAASTTMQAGFVLLGAGSLTPQGLSGAIVLGTTRALACGAFLLLAAAMDDRARTTDTSRLGGIASQVPGWTSMLAVAGLAQAGVFGLGGAWGPVLALIGALSSYAPLAIASAIALVVVAAAHLVIVSRVAFAALDSEWETSAALVPYGGKFPDLTSREWTSIAPLAAIVVVLGFWPAPVVATTTGTVRDLSNLVSPPGPDKVALR